MAVFNRCPQIDELLIENNINDGVNVPKPCVPRRYTELHAQPRNNWDYPSLSIILSHRFSPDFISPRIYPRSRPSIPIWLSLVLDYFVPFSFLFFITRPYFSPFLSLPLRSLPLDVVDALSTDWSLSKTEDGRARFNVGEAVNFDSRSENCLRPVTF